MRELYIFSAVHLERKILVWILIFHQEKNLLSHHVLTQVVHLLLNLILDYNSKSHHLIKTKKVNSIMLILLFIFRFVFFKIQFRKKTHLERIRLLKNECFKGIQSDDLRACNLTSAWLTHAFPPFIIFYNKSK